MVDRLKEIPVKLLEWWNRFTSKQKTIIICIVSAVVISLAILVTVLTRPKYELLANCESTKEASQITELLDGAAITYTVSDDGYQIHVLKEHLSDANLLLGANDIPSAAYGIENVTDGGFSTTESDKQKRYKLFLQGQMEEDLRRFEAVKNVDVQLSLPENDGTLLSKNEEAFASIILELDGEFTQENATAMAQFVKTVLTGAPAVANGWDGLREVQLANAIYVSGWEECRVALPVAEARYLEGLHRRQRKEQEKT